MWYNSWCKPPQWQVAWQLYVIQAHDKQTFSCISLSCSQVSRLWNQGISFYLEGHKHIITFTGTQIALILSQTGQATVASCPGPSVWLLQTSVAITSLIPFYEILFYPITNLIQEWLAKREWMAATPRWTSGSSKASNGSSMSCKKESKRRKSGVFGGATSSKHFKNVLGRRRLYLDICVIGVEASSAHSNQAYVPMQKRTNFCI